MNAPCLDSWNAALMGLAPDASRTERQAWQLERLRQVCERARELSRFYAHSLADIDTGRLAANGDLAGLPFTTAQDLYGDPQSFLCIPASQIARIATLQTSGSSGQRKRIFSSAADIERSVDFFDIGMRHIAEPGGHTLILMPGFSEHSIGRLLQRALERSGRTAVIGRTDWELGTLLDQAGKADCLVGIPGEIIWLCRRAAWLRPRSVLLSADYVPRSVSTALEETWCTRVFCHYGLTETGYGAAVQCPYRGGQHIRDAELLVEIVDPGTGLPLPAGKSGEIVITTLQNEAMPLIRYCSGDMAALLDAPCPCGGVMPRLGRIDGRLGNIIALGGAQSLSIHRLDELLFSLPTVRSFAAGLDLSVTPARLNLLVDSEDPIDSDFVLHALPARLTLHIDYAPLNPFQTRAKRHIVVSGR